MIMKKYILIWWLSLTSIALSAQTLAEARKLYADGNYAEAKPAFEKLVKATPSNANYNLWYGVCALRTGDAVEALPYLQTAVKRKVADSQLFLAEACNQLYLFEEATDALETYIADLKKRRKTSEQAETLLEDSRNGLRMIRGVEQVTVIDSIVVDKADFLSHFSLGSESGNLLFAHQLVEAAQQEGTLFQSELKDKIYYSDIAPNDSTYSLFTTQLVGGQWTEPVALPEEINQPGANTGYPFVMPDGITIYFASDGDESLGGYDIFVTRHDPQDDSYFTPENIGMPFNSPYNDYLYAIDEFNNLGWFASDRFQPEGKVCIYVFIPREMKSVYNYEHLDKGQMARLAQLQAIRDTWKDNAEVREAQGRLAAVSSEPSAQSHIRDFAFVINDNHTYYQLSDFRSRQAREAFTRYQQIARSYEDTLRQLDDLRNQYAQGNDNTKQRLGASIRNLEEQEKQLYEQQRQAANQVRSLEINTLK